MEAGTNASRGEIIKIHTMKQRELTADDMEKFKNQDKRLVPPFKAQQLEHNAKKYWDQFYNRNKTNFFKDRHWTVREFQELLEGDSSIMLEVGCGVGNLVFPLLEEGTNMFIHACDFSQKAVDFVKSHELYNPQRVHAFQADITSNELLEKMNGTSVDVVTMVFVLSAIHPDKFSECIQNIKQVLTPGGVVLFRDYGIYDMTQIRFKPGNKIQDNFYVRQDGTRSYFFSVEKLRTLFASQGFDILTCSYVESRTVNKKEMIDVPRVFVQAKFKNPCNLNISQKNKDNS